MADINLKTLTPDTSLPTDGFLFGADSQSAANPSVFTTQAVATTLLGSTALTGATVTTSQPVLNLSQTWNAGAVTFKGAVFNVTNTASALASRFFEIQEGGTPRFGVGIYSAGYPAVYLNNIQALAVNSSNVAQLGSSNNAATLCGYWTVDHTTGRLYSSNALYNLAFGTSVYMFGAGAGTLQLGQADAAAPVAQTLQVQSVVAGTSNTAGANFTINGSKGTGTGAGGSIIFQVAPAGSSGTAQNAYATALTLDSSATLATFGGSVTNTGDAYYCNHTGATETRGFRVRSTASFSFSSSGASGAPDLLLLRDAANTLALRNGTNAQALRAYNTFTDSSNGEWFAIDWKTTSNIALVGPAKNGTGTQRVQRLQYLEDGGTGSTTPSLGTTCPAASATIKSWIKVVTSDGTTGYIPCWA